MRLGTVSEETSVSASLILNVAETPAGEYDILVYLVCQPTPWSYPHYVSRALTLWVRAYPEDPFSLISASTVATPIPAGISGARIDLETHYPDGIGDALYNASAKIKSVPYFSSKSGSYQAGTIEPGSNAMASFYLDVSPSAPEGQHVIPFEVKFKTWPGGEFRTIERRVPIQVFGVPIDPFGGLSVVSSPSVLFPGARGVRLELVFGLPEG